MKSRQINVLVIEASANMRKTLSDIIESSQNLNLAGTASDAFVGRDKIVRLQPDVLLINIELPRLDGSLFIKKLMPQHPIPIVVISPTDKASKKKTIEALSAGAVASIGYSSDSKEQNSVEWSEKLQKMITGAATEDVSRWKKIEKRQDQPPRTNNHLSHDIIAIGASTGGTEALIKVLKKLPNTLPGVVVVQHMPPGFTKMFAERLDQICMMDAKEAENNDQIVAGRILVAPGDFHLKVIKRGASYFVRSSKGEKVKGHRPSIDVMMRSVADSVGARSVGVILTGMGSDGAEGLLEMRKRGAVTLGQDRESSIVYGMPKVAFDLGATDKMLHIEDIGRTLVKICGRKNGGTLS